MIVLTILIAGTALAASAFCHGLCDMLMLARTGGDMTAVKNRLSVSLFFAVSLPAAAAAWAAFRLLS
ncbi:hypothetical protein [Agathobaculum sp.]|uniref:hypothetical protein n=1 Tax=Agathobaculum sp. TaxID=2048138 RepID=UPI002A82C054|nr:hypothetical protein [Agathobaculum sp.]MDY3617930.1 hypothetical protein [Agathobaculum sp.]